MHKSLSLNIELLVNAQCLLLIKRKRKKYLCTPRHFFSRIPIVIPNNNAKWVKRSELHFAYHPLNYVKTKIGRRVITEEC